MSTTKKKRDRDLYTNEVVDLDHDFEIASQRTKFPKIDSTYTRERKKLFQLNPHYSAHGLLIQSIGIDLTIQIELKYKMKT
jgi:hypothetical protein